MKKYKDLNIPDSQHECSSRRPRYKHMMIPLYHPFKTKNQKNYRSRTSPFTRKDTITIPSHKPFCLKIRRKETVPSVPLHNTTQRLWVH